MSRDEDTLYHVKIVKQVGGLELWTYLGFNLKILTVVRCFLLIHVFVIAKHIRIIVVVFPDISSSKLYLCSYNSGVTYILIYQTAILTRQHQARWKCISHKLSLDHH